MKWIKLLESFKEYRIELDRLNKEIEDKKKLYLTNILSELKECMYDLTDNWEYELTHIAESKEITIYYYFNIPISLFKEFTDDLKSSTDIVISKLEPTKIKINELSRPGGGSQLSFAPDYELIWSKDIEDSVRIKNWSDYYNELIDCLFDKKDPNSTDTRWREFIIQKTPIYKRFQYAKDDKIEVTIRIII